MNRIPFVEAGGRPGEVDAMSFKWAAENGDADAIALGLLHAFAYDVALYGVCEESFDLFGYRVSIEVADGDDHEVLRCVPTFEEASYLSPIELPDIRRRPENWSSVGMRLITFPKGEVAENMSRCVLRTSNLFEDDFAFALNFLFIEDREANGIHEHVETVSPRSRRQGRVIDRLIEGGIGIDMPA